MNRIIKPAHSIELYQVIDISNKAMPLKIIDSLWSADLSQIVWMCIQMKRETADLPNFQIGTSWLKKTNKKIGLTVRYTNVRRRGNQLNRDTGLAPFEIDELLA